MEDEWEALDEHERAAAATVSLADHQQAIKKWVLKISNGNECDRLALDMWEDLVSSRPSINSWEALIKSLLFVAEYLSVRGLCTLLTRVSAAAEAGNIPLPHAHNSEPLATKGEEEEEMSLSSTSTVETNEDAEDSTSLSTLGYINKNADIEGGGRKMK